MPALLHLPFRVHLDLMEIHLLIFCHSFKTYPLSLLISLLLGYQTVHLSLPLFLPQRLGVQRESQIGSPFPIATWPLSAIPSLLPLLLQVLQDATILHQQQFQNVTSLMLQLWTLAAGSVSRLWHLLWLLLPLHLIWWNQWINKTVSRMQLTDMEQWAGVPHHLIGDEAVSLNLRNLRVAQWSHGRVREFMKLGWMIWSLHLGVGRPVVNHPLEDIYFKKLSACSLKVIGLYSQNMFTFLAWTCTSPTIRPNPVPSYAFIWTVLSLWSLCKNLKLLHLVVEEQSTFESRPRKGLHSVLENEKNNAVVMVIYFSSPLERFQFFLDLVILQICPRVSESSCI